MGTIKDITDLTIELINSVKDRKLTSKITQIQSLIGTFQSEQFAMVEKNTELLADNFQLKQEISELKNSYTREISELEEKHKQEMSYLVEQINQLKKQLSDSHKYSDLDNKLAESYST